MKRKQQKNVYDKNASFGPPDKRQHFDDTDSEELPRSKRRKVDEDGEEDNESSDTPCSNRREVEVLYADGIWYRGWLSSYNFEIEKWSVQFYDDNKTTEVNFPNDEVRVLN